MNPDDPDPLLSPIPIDFDKTVHRQRMLVHGDLIAFGKIGVKIVLPSKKAIRSNLAGSGQSHFDRKFDSFSIDHGQRAWLSGADRTG
jgi:hypothetical protein